MGPVSWFFLITMCRSSGAQALREASDWISDKLSEPEPDKDDEQ